MGEEADDCRDDGEPPDILIHPGPHRPFEAGFNRVSHVEISMVSHLVAYLEKTYNNTDTNQSKCCAAPRSQVVRTGISIVIRIRPVRADGIIPSHTLKANLICVGTSEISVTKVCVP